MQDRTTRRDIRIGKDIENESNRDAVHNVPAFAQQIFRDGVKAGTNAVIEVSFQDHQPRVQHAKPGEDQRRH